MVMHYWNQLNSRERLVVMAGLGCLGILLSYLLVYAPIHNALIAKTQDVQEKQDILNWMRHVRPQLKNTQAVKSLSETERITFIANQLQRSSLNTFEHQVQQSSQGEVQLSFDSVPFNALLQWLWSLNQSTDITIKQLTVERTNTNGLVKAQVLID